MDKLTYELLGLCKHNHDGSRGTQAQRKKQLKLFAEQLKELGYRHMGAKSLGARHVIALVEYWLTKPSKSTNKLISPGTIKNRMAALRWWARKINKSGVIPKDNRALGIPNRQRLPSYNKAFKLTDHQISKLPDHLKISLRLQQEFGLRREEAAKFIPAMAIKEDRIELKRSWTKGGRARSIPITAAGQRELLKEIGALNQNASLIPAKINYRQYLSHRDHHLGIAGIRQAHGLRYYYAQQLYIVLSNGLMPPMLCDGEKPTLTQAEQELDLKARLIVSQELGHDRISVTCNYLG